MSTACSVIGLPPGSIRACSGAAARGRIRHVRAGSTRSISWFEELTVGCEGGERQVRPLEAAVTQPKNPKMGVRRRSRTGAFLARFLTGMGNGGTPYAPFDWAMMTAAE